MIIHTGRHGSTCRGISGPGVQEYDVEHVKFRKLKPNRSVLLRINAVSTIQMSSQKLNGSVWFLKEKRKKEWPAPNPWR